MTDEHEHLQRAFCDRWNIEHRAGDLDGFMARQLEQAVSALDRMGGVDQPLRVLEVGCGTGWLSGALSTRAEVTGVDLSDAAIQVARARHPNVRFLSGDFSSLQLPAGFDLVIRADVIAHVPDQQEFVHRIAELLRPGGLFLLMTQNGFVWRRSSYLAPQQPGQIRNWPSLAAVRELLNGSFEVIRVGSIAPGGDQGVLRILNARELHGLARRLRFGAAWTQVLERARVGRELVVLARRR